MALVNYNYWQRLAVAILDCLVEGNARQSVEGVIVDVVQNDEFPRARVAAMLEQLIEQGSVLSGSDDAGPYVTIANPGRARLRAMRDVWEGSFPK